MRDDEYHTRGPATGKPIPPPAGFATWRAWFRAGCPTFTVIDDVPVPRLHRPDGLFRRADDQVDRSGRLPEVLELDFFGRAQTRSRRPVGK